MTHKSLVNFDYHVTMISCAPDMADALTEC